MRVSKHGHPLNLIPDKKDKRDFLYHAPRRFLTALPPKVDYEVEMPDVYNQGELGSCAGQAVAAMIQWQRKKTRKVDFTPSRLFLYFNARVDIGTVAEDSGCTLRDCVKEATNQGAPPEQWWPYDISQFATRAPDVAYEEAMDWQILAYTKPAQDLDQMRGCLAHIGPFVAGLQIYDSFESSAVSESGVVPMPKRGWFSGERRLGGHAVTIIGYDDSVKIFKLRNSWGKDWGKNGCAWIPFEYMLDPKLASDLWVAKVVE